MYTGRRVWYSVVRYGTVRYGMLQDDTSELLEKTMDNFQAILNKYWGRIEWCRDDNWMNGGTCITFARIDCEVRVSSCSTGASSRRIPVRSCCNFEQCQTSVSSTQRDRGFLSIDRVKILCACSIPRGSRGSSDHRIILELEASKIYLNSGLCIISLAWKRENYIKVLV